MAGLNHERLIIAAQALGMAQRGFDDALLTPRSASSPGVRS
jgi:alkylation response protein AidB-like acyl-CoA dehydrogenase